THFEIAAIKRYGAEARVHNLTIADIHTYYVLAGDVPVLVHNADKWCKDEDELDDIDTVYGPRVVQGVEYMIDEYNKGKTTHALNNIGKDAKATARYLRQPRKWTHVDNNTGNWVTYDDTNKIIIIRTAQDIHAYNYSETSWNGNVGKKYLEPPAGTTPPAWP
ncbi:hypothetical protein, partial [Actinoplanes xinjiangensis]